MNSICNIATFMGFNACKSSQERAVEGMFAEHVSKFGLSFGTKEEYEFRLNLFAQKELEIGNINADPKNKNFRVGHNKFSTWTDDEFKRLLGNKDPVNYTGGAVSQLETPDDLPASVDWRTKGALNPVKDQGHCGSCWAFAATACIESHHFIHTGELLNLAEQQLVDCDPQSDGCDGGYAMWGFEYAHTHFQELQTSYPYTAQTGQCNYDQKLGKVKVKEHYLVQPQSIEALQVAILHGPVGVSVEADKPVFRNYESGVLDSEDCGIATNHAIVAVGYGTTAGGQVYYIVRNSWSASWGD